MLFRKNYASVNGHVSDQVDLDVRMPMKSSFELLLLHGDADGAAAARKSSCPSKIGVLPRPKGIGSFFLGDGAAALPSHR